jgi:hypothetical protein
MSGDKAIITVDCIAGAAPGSFAALPGTDRTGPFDAQVFNELNGFQARWWREPTGGTLYIGTPVKVPVEVENLRAPAAGTPGAWGLQGELHTAAGTALEPRGYPQAPPHGVTIPFRGVWSADYNFTCRKADIASLQHSFTLLPPTTRRGGSVSGRKGDIPLPSASPFGRRGEIMCRLA